MNKLYATEMKEFLSSDLFKALEKLVKNIAFHVEHDDFGCIESCLDQWKAYSIALKYITGKEYKLRKSKYEGCCGIYEKANYDVFLIKFTTEDCLATIPSNAGR